LSISCDNETLSPVQVDEHCYASPPTLSPPYLLTQDT